jgi:peptide/nickel transport system permease protein
VTRTTAAERVIVAQWLFIGTYSGPLGPAVSGRHVGPTGRTYLRDAWWISVFPGLAIFAAVLFVNLLGDGLRDALDPSCGSR